MQVAGLLVGLSLGLMLPYATQILLPYPLFALAVAAVCLAVSGWLATRAFSKHLYCLFLAAIVLGWSWSSLRADWQLARSIPASSMGQDLVIEGTVLGLPELRSSPATSLVTSKFYFLVDAVLEDGDKIPINAKLRMSWRQPDRALQPGSRWRFSVRLKPPVGLLNFHGFDYEAWLYTQSVNGTGYVRGEARRLAGPGLRRLPHQWRAQLREKIDALFAEAPERGALLRGLLIGDRSAISDEQWQAMRATGTAHLMAISGLHIGLVAGLGIGLTRLLWPLFGLWAERLAARRAAVFVAGGLAFGYALLAGMQLPAQRALIMLTVLLVALWYRRPVQPWLALLVAFALVLLWQPSAVLSGGFWLSFLAVFWIIYILAWRRPQAGFLLGLLRVQLALTLGLWPISWFWFAEIAWLSPLVNLLAVPLMGVLVMPLLFVGAGLWLAGDFWALGSSILLNLAMLLDWSLTTLAQLNAGLPKTSVAPLPLWLLLVSQLALLIALAPLPWTMRLLALPLSSLLPLWSPTALREGQLRVTFFDVGQGQSVLLQTRSRTLLYDAGARFGSGFDMGERVVVPQLRAVGVEHLDALVMSHGDLDHYGGLDAVTRSYPQTSQLWLGGVDKPALLFSGTRARCLAGIEWHWDGVGFRFLSPTDGEQTSTDNDDSCVLRVDTGEHSILLTGDISAMRERWLIQRYASDLQASVLQVPHHGSNSSSSAAFITAVSPTLALASAGFANRFGHPAKPVQERYQQQGVGFISTSDSGAVQLLFSADGERDDWMLMTARQSKKRFWRP